MGGRIAPCFWCTFHNSFSICSYTRSCRVSEHHFYRSREFWVLIQQRADGCLRCGIPHQGRLDGLSGQEVAARLAGHGGGGVVQHAECAKAQPLHR